MAQPFARKPPPPVWRVIFPNFSHTYLWNAEWTPTGVKMVEVAFELPLIVVRSRFRHPAADEFTLEMMAHDVQRRLGLQALPEHPIPYAMTLAVGVDSTQLRSYASPEGIHCFTSDMGWAGYSSSAVEIATTGHVPMMRLEAGDAADVRRLRSI